MTRKQAIKKLLKYDIKHVKYQMECGDEWLTYILMNGNGGGYSCLDTK